MTRLENAQRVVPSLSDTAVRGIHRATEGHPSHVLDLRPAVEWIPRQFRAVRGPLRWLPYGFGLLVAVAGPIDAVITESGAPLSRWTGQSYFDLVLLPLGLGGMLFFRMTSRKTRASESLTFSAQRIIVSFSDSSTETLDWADPHLEAELIRGSDPRILKGQELLALSAGAWVTPAFLTPEAYQEILGEAERRGASLETSHEELGAARKTKIRIRAARPVTEPPG
jgi:hypothetical protein